ncbi:hypothetical protein [Sphingomonas sp. Marseille-Q8236]
MNDTYPTDVTVRIISATDSNTCAISFEGSGGLMVMRGCIWSQGYLHWGCQNGKIDGCWGMGIQFAAGSVNTTEISSGYIYPNTARGTLLWSESYANFQSVRALTITATQMITFQPTETYSNLNMYSMIKYQGCEFLGPGTTMLGPNSRSDSFATVLVKLEGGKHTGSLSLNDRAGHRYIIEGFINDSTGLVVPNDKTFVPLVGGQTVTGVGTYTTNTGKWWREGNRVFFEMRITWTAQGGSGPMFIYDLPLPAVGSNTAARIAYAGNTFGVPAYALISGTIITFFNASTGAALALTATGDLVLSGDYQVAA